MYLSRKSVNFINVYISQVNFTVQIKEQTKLNPKQNQSVNKITRTLSGFRLNTPMYILQMAITIPIT